MQRNLPGRRGGAREAAAGCLDRDSSGREMSAMAASTEHDNQLRTGLRLVETAYNERVRALEAEFGALRAWGQEQQDLAAASMRRTRELEAQLGAADACVHDATREKGALEARLHELTAETAMLRSADERNHELQVGGGVRNPIYIPFNAALSRQT
ncbi:hypothetical protein T492DRAFT_228102 [Pavlovales sp. CCMP2436]|nr:hypothetical protein T492DRAFT_228102 [Pavlovales sp. CCMP2436]